jgi:hypothetical protein
MTSIEHPGEPVPAEPEDSGEIGYRNADEQAGYDERGDQDADRADDEPPYDEPLYDQA